MTSVCPIGDGNFDHLVSMMSARFLLCKVNIFSFVINKSSVGRYVFHSLLSSLL